MATAQDTGLLDEGPASVAPAQKGIPSTMEKLAPSLAAMSSRGGYASEMVTVIVTMGGAPATGQKDSSGVLADTKAPVVDSAFGARVGATVDRPLSRLPFRIMRVPVQALASLARSANVRYVSPDSEVLGAANQAVLQTARVPGSNGFLNTANVAYKGTGVTVAVLDTGIYPHSDFYNLAGQLDFVNGANAAPVAYSDPFGHGTHVAGMIGATGLGSTNGKYQGSSTQARILSLRVLDGEGRGNMSDVLRALDWMLTTGISQYGIRVANLSLGKGVEEVQALDPLVQGVNAVWDAGVVMVVSAGNHGASGHHTICSPGNSRKVITVGSLTDSGTGLNWADDYVSSFSSRGPTLFDHVLKPDLIAPGNNVMSTYANNSRLGQLLPGRIACGATCTQKYLRLSGTSMAAAVVSGAAARMIEKTPTLTPATVKARLMRSARKIPGDPTATGAGVLDVESAMNATGTVSGAALSPVMGFVSSTNRVSVEDPSRLWGSIWSAGSLWPDSPLWENDGQGNLWSNGSLWPDASLWADANIWTNGFLWTDSVMPASVDNEDPDSPEASTEP
jgi:serine protease AprX